MNDDDVRAVLAAAIEANSGLGGNGTVLRLARIGRELMRQRDARSEDFLRVADELTALKAKYAELEAKLAKARADVAEEIAQALEGMVDGYPEDVFPPNSDSRDAIGGNAMRHAYRMAALMAREHDGQP